MISANNKIRVSVDSTQKESVMVGNSNILLAKDFSNNRRESNPVVCLTIEGNKDVPRGTSLLVHHNRFVQGSPHYLGGNEYSLAYNTSIFAKINSDGSATSLCDNILVEYVYNKVNELIPDHLRKPDRYMYKVLKTGFGFKKGQLIFAYEFANYEIVYVWKGVEYRVIKIAKSDIVGKIQK